MSQDEHARRLDDIEKRLEGSSLYALTMAVATTQKRVEEIEKRLARLERAAEKPPMTWSSYTRDTAGNLYQVSAQVSQWCECGRDVCRAPDCPSHRSDPMGR